MSKVSVVINLTLVEFNGIFEKSNNLQVVVGSSINQLHPLN